MCVCVRAPRQFNSSVTKTFCTAFNSCSFPRRHSLDLSHLPALPFPHSLPLLHSPPPHCLTLLPLHSQLATLIGIIDFDNRRQHRRTEPPSPQQTLLSVCLICHFFHCALSPPPATTPSPSNLLQFLQFFLFFSPTFLAQAETQLAKFVCVFLCVFA